MKRTVLALSAVAVLALPAHAEGPEGQRLDDGCGDAPVVAADGTTVVAGEGHYDIDALRVQDLLVGGQPAGVEVALDLCSDVPVGETAGGWTVTWRLPDDCEAQLRVFESRLVTVDGATAQRAAEVRVLCPVDDDLSLGEQEQRRALRLDDTAFSVQGRTVSWTLARGALGPLEELAAPGAVVAAATGHTSSRGTGGTLFVGTQARVSTAGTVDDAGPAADHVVR